MTPISLQHAPRAFVIGHPISHSRSPLIHRFWLEALGLAGSYEAVDVAPSGLAGFVGALRDGAYVGGNVTLPHKQAVFACVDQIAPEAAAIGAVNTVWLDGRRIIGGNTDAHGFLANLDERAPGWDAGAGLAVVLGAGGAARSVVFGLLQRGLRVHLANRTPAAAEALVAHFGAHVSAGDLTGLAQWLRQADLLVNATSLGMVGAAPLTLDLAPLRPGAVVCDIVYVPLLTPLLRDAQARGHPVVDGLGMLLHQAAPGFARWFGHTPVVTQALRDRVAAHVEGR